MSLSYTSKFGYYGLRVNPTFEQVVGTVRTPLRIPLPDRKAKWYANSPYRALILDAEEKYQNYERAAIDYRLTGADAPESAARVRPSDAGADETFDRIDDHHRKIEEHEAIETSHQLMQEHESRKTAASRREILRLSHAPNRTNPTIEMEHAELEGSQGCLTTCRCPEPCLQKRSLPDLCRSTWPTDSLRHQSSSRSSS